eukprot:TRINITY_DN22693_c0_g1_i3.p1 TRINITY_DN22693_c0_g1~~TRINITY_DN22693_c0_g1_i3.p1  ORF type:complete len:1006 (+),score=206.88 TRINITY_DN22693_c0_g1_i3:94-3111(+)
MGDAPENKEDSSNNGILALPQLPETKIIASLWRPKFLQGLLAPVLHSEASADFRSKAVALGGPPRNPDRVVTKDKGATLLPVVPVAEKPVVVSSRQLGRWPVKPPRNPRKPRAATRRLLALQGAYVQPAKPSPRPMSPHAVAEALYTRDLLGGEPAIWRGDQLDDEMAGREEELVEFARHRLDCQLAAQREGRERAAKWRGRQAHKEALYQISWMLEESLPGRPPSPPALDANVARLMLGETSILREEELILKSDLDANDDADLDEIVTKDIAPPPSPELSRSEVEDDAEDEDASKKKKKKNRVRPSLMHKEVMLRRLAGDLGSLTEASIEEMRSRHLKDSQAQENSLVQTSIDVSLGMLETGEREEQEEPERDESPMFEDHDHAEEALLLETKSPTAAAASEVVDDNIKSFAQKFLSRVTFKVFEPYSKDNMIDQADLKLFLADMGLRPRNETERSALAQVLMKFNDLEYSFQTLINEIIPEVRICLTELWMPRLIALYKAADVDNSGMLSIQELERIVLRSGFSPGIPKVAEAVVDVMPDSLPMFSNVKGELLLDRNVVDLPRFAVLAPLLQQRTLSQRLLRARQISEAENLDAETSSLWGSCLVDLEIYFLKWAVLGNSDEDRERGKQQQRLLPLSALPKVATQIGIMSRRGPAFKQTLLHLARRTHVREGAEGLASLSHNSKLTLGHVIRILSIIRREECTRASRIFNKGDKDNTQGLTLRECLRCLHECGVQVINRSESMYIRKLVDEFDLDGSGELELDEFLKLVKFVAQRLKDAHRINAADKARSLGFSETEGERIWEVFLDSDENMDEQLDEKEIHTAVVAFFAPETSFSAQELDQVLQDLGYASPLRRLEVTIWDFISILKCCQERASRPKIALKLGLDSESAAGFMEMWKSFRPSASDTVPAKAVIKSLKKMPGKGQELKLARLKDLMANERSDMISFTHFLQIMSRTSEPVNPEKKAADGDEDRLFNNNVRKLQFGSIEVLHDAAMKKDEVVES